MSLQGLNDGFVETLQRSIEREVEIVYSHPDQEPVDGRLLRVTNGTDGWEAVLSQGEVEKVFPVAGAAYIEVW